MQAAKALCALGCGTDALRESLAAAGALPALVAVLRRTAAGGFGPAACGSGSGADGNGATDGSSGASHSLSNGNGANETQTNGYSNGSSNDYTNGYSNGYVDNGAGNGSHASPAANWPNGSNSGRLSSTGPLSPFELEPGPERPAGAAQFAAWALKNLTAGSGAQRTVCHMLRFCLTGSFRFLSIFVSRLPSKDRAAGSGAQHAAQKTARRILRSFLPGSMSKAPSACVSVQDFFHMPSKVLRYEMQSNE